MRWPRRMTPASSSIESGGNRTSSFWPRRLGVFLLPHQYGESAIGLKHRAGAVERNDAGGDRFENGFELATARFNGLIGGGELRRRALGKLAAGIEIGRHVIERTHQFGHLAGSDKSDAVFVFAGGDLVHGVGQCFDGARDLLGEKEGEPDAGKEDHNRDEQQHQEERGADAVAGTKEIPVFGCAFADARGGLAQTLRHGQSCDHDLSGSRSGFAERVIMSCNADDGFVVALGRAEDAGGERALQRDGGLELGCASLFGKPGNQACLADSRGAPESW